MWLLVLKLFLAIGVSAGAVVTLFATSWHDASPTEVSFFFVGNLLYIAAPQLIAFFLVLPLDCALQHF